MRKILFLVLSICILMIVGCSNVEQHKKDYVTEKFFIQSKTDNGYLLAKSIEQDSKAPYGFVLEDKYDIGDIVEISFKGSKAISVHKIKGKKLKRIESKYDVAINSLMDEGIKLDYENRIQTKLLK